MITIKVNDKKHQFLNTITLQKLVEEIHISTNGIAIAVNNNVIKKENWVTQNLENDDDILIIKSTQGG